MKRYEYKTLKITKQEDVQNIISEMGRKGWKLVTIESLFFYFIREAKKTE